MVSSSDQPPKPPRAKYASSTPTACAPRGLREEVRPRDGVQRGHRRGRCGGGGGQTKRRGAELRGEFDAPRGRRASKAPRRCSRTSRPTSSRRARCGARTRRGQCEPQTHIDKTSQRLYATAASCVPMSGSRGCAAAEGGERCSAPITAEASVQPRTYLGEGGRVVRRIAPKCAELRSGAHPSSTG